MIGGGISGLATAALLAQEGYEVTLLEARDALGGRAGEWDTDGYRFETGPSWYLMPEVFDHFFRLLGTTADEQLELHQAGPRVPRGVRAGRRPARRGGRRSSGTASATWRSRNRSSRAPGKRLAAYLDSAAWVYRTAKRFFLYTTFADLKPLATREVLGGLPRLVPMLGLSLHRSVTDRRFKDPRLAQILQYPAVFLGSSPYATPGMYHLMSTLDFEGGVLYPKGGITALIDAVRRQAEERGVRDPDGYRRRPHPHGRRGRRDRRA